MNDKHELENITWGIIPITAYRGALVEKIIGGYKVLNKKASSPKEVDEIIDKAQDSIKNSLPLK